MIIQALGNPYGSNKPSQKTIPTSSPQPSKSTIIAPLPAPTTYQAQQPTQVTVAKVEKAPIIGQFLGTVKESAKKVLDVSKIKSGEGLGASIGRVMQLLPNTKVTIPEKYKSKGLYDEIVEFVTQIPSSIVQSYGKSLEMLSTPEGKKQVKQGIKDLPKTVVETKQHMEKKEWGLALETLFSNPAIPVALDVADFVPVAGIVGFGIKKGRDALLKQAAKEGIEEVGEKLVKEAIEEVPEKI